MTPPELPPLDLHCESGRAHAAYTPESVEARESILVAEIERLRAHASALAEVMAMIHGDGGHYLAKHGAHKAAEDAAKKHATLCAEVEAMRAELCNIAYADTSTWESDMRDQFKPWAQSRARSAIDAARGAP